MCAGLRDAANLAWKLAEVINGKAMDALLDTYEIERRPHVKAIIDLALMMGRTVCILDPKAAAARDAAMLAQRASAGPDVAGEGFKFPPLAGPAIFPSPAAGDLFIQPWSSGRRWDDVVGDGPWLITTETVEPMKDVRVFNLADPGIAAFSGAFRTWLAKHSAASVLVRPDRYVFGAGRASELLSRWTSALR
jgi:3-(3-hydroxy-phenyl)propionate hydroxylase